MELSNGILYFVYINAGHILQIIWKILRELVEQWNMQYKHRGHLRYAIRIHMYSTRRWFYHCSVQPRKQTRFNLYQFCWRKRFNFVVENSPFYGMKIKHNCSDSRYLMCAGSILQWNVHKMREYMLYKTNNYSPWIHHLAMNMIQYFTVSKHVTLAYRSFD